MDLQELVNQLESDDREQPNTSDIKLSIINVPGINTSNKDNILEAVKKCLTPAFKQSLSNADSLFGNGESADKIYKILKN